MEGIKNFLKSLFSLNEQRYSTVCTMFVVLMGVVTYIIFKTHTLDGNITNLVIAFVVAIIGGNGVQSVSDAIQLKSQLKNLENKDNNNQPTSLR